MAENENITHGTVAQFGLAAAQTGILIQSQDATYKAEKITTKDHAGNTVGARYYDPHTEISISGEIPAESTQAQIRVASTLALANALEDYGMTSTTGDVLIDEIKVSKKNTEHATIDITASAYPKIAASAS